MKNFSILFLFALIVLASACGDDDAPIGATTDVNLNFTGVYDTDPLVMINKTYKYPDGKQVFFTDVNFFISEVVLIEAGSGDETELIDIEYVDFSGNTSEADAAVPLSFSSARIPTGSYSGIRIGIGVPADLNNSDANQFGEDHPLRKNFGQFWSGWDSFIFTMINGQYDDNGDGVFNADDPGFNHHLGSDAVYRTINIPKNMELVEGQPFDINLKFDLRKLYGDEAEHLDLSDSANLLTHNPDDLTVANYLIQNFEFAVSIE